ncbi:MAG: 50S ribosomal protein L31 [Candidatus Paceibacterota bacterium]|jgi:large subunit ribosomal protein L31
MKKDIHPKYYSNAKVVCSCGNKFTVGSTKEEIKVEICSACHPFFSGAQKIMDTAGRVEKFKARTTKSTALKATAKEKKSAKSAKTVAKK